MSKLKELIEELCPNGVEYKELGEVCEIKTGKGITKNDATEGGTFPIISGGQSPMGFYHLSNRKANTVTISRVGAYAGFVSLIKEDFYLNDKCFSVIPTSNIITTSFLYYCLKNIEIFIKELQSEGGVPTINTTKVAHITIPIPPIAVQEEIVRILDKLSDSVMQLQRDLEEELRLRKVQYEYYRNQLLSFKSCGDGDEQEDSVTTWGGESYEVKWKKLGEICKMQAGKSIDASIISASANENYYPCYGANGLRGYVPLFNSEGENVIIGRQGALCGNVAYAKGKYYATDHAVVVKDTVNNPRFLFHLLTNANLNQYKTQGAQPGLSVAILNSVVVPIPPIELQEKIVEILDRFEFLVNDLRNGLPAEITAVRARYEYYRDMLLSFPQR